MSTQKFSKFADVCQRSNRRVTEITRSFKRASDDCDKTAQKSERPDAVEAVDSQSVDNSYR